VDRESVVTVIYTNFPTRQVLLCNGMDSWPCHGKKHASEGLAKKRQDATETLPYPLVTHGGPNLVTLVERDGRFQWTTLFKGNAT